VPTTLDCELLGDLYGPHERAHELVAAGDLERLLEAFAA
jgi:hypothetical protein